MKNLMKLVSIAMISTASIYTQGQAKTEAERYKEAVQKQTAERLIAFNQDHIQHDSAKLQEMIVRQRERILQLQKEMQRSR